MEPSASSGPVPLVQFLDGIAGVPAVSDSRA
jgi:hypothetical protein